MSNYLRFPTRIVSRRTPNEDDVVRISIEPDMFDWLRPFFLVETPSERTERLAAYANFAHSSCRITAYGLKDAMECVRSILAFQALGARKTESFLKAGKLMGIIKLESTGDDIRNFGNRNFATDIFKIELSGPNRSTFGAIELPGVFEPQSTELTEREKHGIRDMIASYVSQKKNIMV
ncbi:MAG: hypothetical protein Q9219_001645 [cf. Caloplaca sp. 3 TL-2023]